jgi:pantoate--beta-alanine ligase
MTRIYRKVADLQAILNEEKSSGKRIGFVPTMGALHAGHISLINRSKNEGYITVCSIFVNPTQFNNAQDLALYPRTEEADVKMLEAANCDYIFLPTVEEIYPDDSHRHIDYDPGKIATVLEGKYRPGHFQGMLAVVKRLLDIVKPDVAYFGQKDYQQYLLISKMAAHYRLPLRIEMSPIIREESGLAMSSRNKRLNHEATEAAAMLYAELQKAEKKLKNGENVEAVKQAAIAELSAEGNFQVDYFDICSANELEPIANYSDKQDVIICVAAYKGSVRLIDNILLKGAV